MDWVLHRWGCLVLLFVAVFQFFRTTTIMETCLLSMLKVVLKKKPCFETSTFLEKKKEKDVSSIYIPKKHVSKKLVCIIETMLSGPIFLFNKKKNFLKN